MLRPRAVRALLLDLAGVRVAARNGETGSDEEREEHRRSLDRAQRQALAFVVIDAVALVIFFLLRDRSRAFLFLGRSEEAVFSLGALVLAAHFGFRFAQFLQMRAVARAWDELPD